MFGDDFGSGIVGRHNIVASEFFCVRDQRTFPFNPVEDHGREDAVAFTIEHLRSVRVEQHSLAAVREDITTAAGERIAEGGAATSVHNIGGHDSEM